MKRNISMSFLAIVLLAMALPVWSQETAKARLKGLPQRHRDWLAEEVVYIISSRERAVFLQLESDRERDVFIEAFWKHRDPTPGTPANEFKEEHYKRIAYANDFLSRDTTRPGWMTDRGKIHILIGPPQDISRYEGEANIYPTQIWSYAGRPEYGLPSHFDIIFFRRRGTGEFVLYSPAQDGPISLLVDYRGDPTSHSTAYEQLRKLNARLADASLSLIPGEVPVLGQVSLASDMLIARVYGIPDKAVDARYAEALLKYKDIIEVDYTANYIASDSLVSVIRDASGPFFVHYAIQPESLSVLPHDGKFGVNFELNGMVTGPEGRVIFQYDKTFPLDFSERQIENVRKTGVLVEDVIPLVPGKYTFGLLLKNTLSKEFTSFEKEIVIPDAAAAGFWISPPLLGYQARRMPAVPRQVKPFRAGDVQISCQPGQTFSAKENLAVFFQVFGMPEELRRSGRVDFVFERNDQEFWRSDVLLKDLPATGIIREFPLQKFPPDYYKLRVSLVDDQNRTAVSADADFIVSPLAEIPRPWVAAKVMPPADHPMYSYLLGEQLFKAGDLDGAVDLLAKAYRANPRMLDYAEGYAEVLVQKKDYRKAKEVLAPLSNSTEGRHEALAFLGTCSQALGEYREAILYFKTYLERAGLRLEVLNSLGQCHYDLGELKEASAAWKKSLEIDPQQDTVRARLERIK